MYLSPAYSTTRRVTRTSVPITDGPDAIFKSSFFLINRPDRQGEGGLRTRGYFKSSGYFDDVKNDAGGNERERRRPLVTILTVVFNGVKTLEQTILSVINQSYDNIEYIILDGGSTDGTLEIIRKYEDVIDYWVSESDKGIYDAMNKGIALCQGSIIGIINSDDFYLPQAINTVVNSYLEHGEAVYHGDLLIVDDRRDKQWCKRPSSDPSLIYSHRMPVNHPSMFVSTSLYKRFGMFSPKYRLSADYDLVCRLLEGGATFHYVSGDVAGFREGGRSGGYQTFKESRVIQIEYGRSRYAAWIGFYWSILKSTIAARTPLKLLAIIRLIKGSDYVGRRAKK